MTLPGWRVGQKQKHDVFPFGQAVPGTPALTEIVDSEPLRTVLPHLSRLPAIKGVTKRDPKCTLNLARASEPKPLQATSWAEDRRSTRDNWNSATWNSRFRQHLDKRRHRGAQGPLPDNWSTCPAPAQAENMMVDAASFSIGQQRGSQERQPKDKRRDGEGRGRVQDSHLGEGESPALAALKGLTDLQELHLIVPCCTRSGIPCCQP